MKKVYQLGNVKTDNMKAVYSYASKNGITKIDDLLVKENAKSKSKKKVKKVEVDENAEVKGLASMG